MASEDVELLQDLAMGARAQSKAVGERLDHVSCIRETFGYAIYLESRRLLFMGYFSSIVV